MYMLKFVKVDFTWVASGQTGLRCWLISHLVSMGSQMALTPTKQTHLIPTDLDQLWSNPSGPQVGSQTLFFEAIFKIFTKAVHTLCIPFSTLPIYFLPSMHKSQFNID